MTKNITISANKPFQNKKKNKVLLITAPWEFGGQELSRIYPLGIAYLGAVLEKAGYNAEGINLGDKDWDKVEDGIKLLIEQENPDVIGISIMSSNRNSAAKLFKIIKEINPKIITIAGGVHTTFMYKQMFENYPDIDIAVLGEGEETILELMNYFNGRKSISKLRKIKGIAFKYNEEIIKTEPRPRMKDLDALPMPKHEYFEDQIKKYKIVYMQTTRGCPFNCKFCPSSPLWGRMISKRNVKNLFNEMQYLIKRFPYIERISFCDDEFIVDNKRVIELCKLIIKNNIKIRWDCIGRVTSVTDEVIKYMKMAGCTVITFGVESGNQQILNNMNKCQTIPQIINAFDICKRQGLKAEPLLICGFPGETSETINDTIKLLKKIRIIGEPGLLFLVPGTQIYEIAKEQGVLDDDYWLTDKPIPFYFKEHSELRLLYWNLKISFYSHLYADENGGIKNFVSYKFLKKLNKERLKAMLKRWI